MKKYIKYLILCLLVGSLICSCASKPLPPPELRPEPGAIRLYLKADPQLNLYHGIPHTILVCAYQLKNTNALNQLADDTEGIYNLLECRLFDASVARSKRLIVHPGQDLNLALDRAEGAKYVAIVAGYHLLQKERMIRLYEVPVIVEKKGWIRRTKIQKLGPLSIELMLGPLQIESSKGK